MWKMKSKVAEKFTGPQGTVDVALLQIWCDLHEKYAQESKCRNAMYTLCKSNETALGIRISTLELGLVQISRSGLELLCAMWILRFA